MKKNQCCGCKKKKKKTDSKLLDEVGPTKIIG